jgi:hypothetical protein
VAVAAVSPASAASRLRQGRVRRCRTAAPIASSLAHRLSVQGPSGATSGSSQAIRRKWNSNGVERVADDGRQRKALERWHLWCSIAPQVPRSTVRKSATVSPAGRYLRDTNETGSF